MKLPIIVKTSIFLLITVVYLVFFSTHISAQSCDGSYECVSTECGNYTSNYSSCTPNPLNPLDDCKYRCVPVTEQVYGCSFQGGTNPSNCRLVGVASCGGGGGSTLRGKCVYSGPYVGPIGYNCVSNSCTAVYSGSYTYSSSTCDGACVVPPPAADSCGWFTNADQCYLAGGSQNCAVKNGSGECDCCTPQNTPSPPPPYGCSNNTCQQVDGPYSGDPACAGSCGIKCSITAPVDTKVASSNHNSKACNIQGQNNVNNPSKIDLNCSSQEHAGHSKNWRIQKLVIPDLNGVGADGIYTNNGTTVTDNTSGKISLSAVNPFGAGTSTKKINLDFNVKLSLTNPNGITDTACSNFTFNPTTTTGIYRASTKCGTQVNNNPLLRTNSLAVVSGNGWGNLSYNGSNVVDSTSKGSNFVESFSSVTANSITTYFYTLTFDVSISHNVSTTINGISVFCEPVIFTNATATYAVGNISCRGNTTEADIRTVLLEKFNMTGLRTITMSVNNNIGTYSDATGRIYKQGGAFNDSVSAFTATGNTYTNNITIIWPDGIPYASRTVKMWITDGTADNTCGTVESSTPTCAYQTQTYTVDTSLPVVEREVSVTSATLLKVVDSATDDYKLKSHALYCGPTDFTSDFNSTPSPFISESRNGVGIGSQQIAGYFDAVSNVKTCNGSFSSGNNNDFQVFNTSAVSDVRSTYYLLDENAIKNQNEPISITFGNGKDGSSLGRWYAEDSFCNLPATSPSTTVDIGSPWLQTKGGNTYVQGNNEFSRLEPDIQAYNYWVNNVSSSPDPNNPALNICSSTIGSVTNGTLKSYINNKNTKSNAALSSYINRINQCPEKDDSYVSTYAFTSNEESSNTGPRGNSDRFSKITQAATTYDHKLNDVSKYTGGDKNLYDYLSKLIDTSGILGYTNTGTAITDSNSPLYNGSGLSIKTIGNSVSVDPASDKDLIKAIDPDVVENVSDKKVNVYKISGNLNVKHNTLANDGAWNINKNSIILVDGDVILEPDIIKNTGSLVIAAKGSIVIGSGSYKSENLTSTQVLAGTAYPLYDRIDAFLITDGKLVTLPDKGISSNIQAMAPVKQSETVAKASDTKLNSDIVKKAEALNGYRCNVRFYKAANHTNPYVAGENIETGQDLYVWIGIQLNSPDFAYDDNDPDWQYTAFKNNGVRLNILAHDLSNGQHNYYMTVPGSSIVNGNNIFQFGVHANYNDRSDATTGDWCEPFTLTGVTTNNPPPVIPPTPLCTDMKINGGYEDVPIVLGSDINVQMTVSNPTDTSGMIRVNNRDNKCNSSRSFRAGLTPLSNPLTYSVMSNATTDPSNWQDCDTPATQVLTTTRFDNISYVDNGNLRTYTYKIKPEQLLKVDVNTGKTVKSFELAGPAGYDDTLNCKVYAHDYKVVYDGLKIFGGVVQTSTFPKGNNLLGSTTISMDGSTFSNSLTCKNSGGAFPNTTAAVVNTGIGSPCFLRDLIMVQNFVAPAEQIEYDPSIQLVFGNILGRKSTILSIRESTTND